MGQSAYTNTPSAVPFPPKGRYAFDPASGSLSDAARDPDNPYGIHINAAGLPVVLSVPADDTNTPPDPNTYIAARWPQFTAWAGRRWRAPVTTADGEGVQVTAWTTDDFNPEEDVAA
jgi:hypothetical protein